MFNRFNRKFANWKSDLHSNEEVNETENDNSTYWWMYVSRPYVHQKKIDEERNGERD